MGVPVSPRNIFPSNIQGLPTWYEVRVTEQGHLGRRGGVDLMVAMNPQTWEKDIAEIEPGGYLMYDSTKPLAAAKLRADINLIGVPLTDIAASKYVDAKERQLLKNIMYVGVLTELLGIEPEVIAQLLGEQYKGKDRLIKPNLDAFMTGLHHARERLEDAIDLRVERRDAVGERIFIEGNAAAALGLRVRRRDRLRVVPNYAFVIAGRSVSEVLQQVSRRQSNWHQQVRDRAGRGRASFDWDRHRRRLERGTFVYRDFRPRHFADERVHRARVFRRDTGGHH